MMQSTIQAPKIGAIQLKMAVEAQSKMLVEDHCDTL